ncbi:MAG: replication initiation protein, partial [Cetobacterium sp.]
LLAVFQKREQGIFVQIPEPIFKALELKDESKKESLYYTAIKLLEKRAFRCVYSVIFYDIFKKYEKINIPIFTVDEIKELTGTSQKYKTYADLKRYVLEKALKELNDFDQKFEYHFSEERLGRKIEKIKFFKVEKNVIDILENEISEKMKATILKARKNRYIDTSYSQKAMDKIIQRYDEKDVIKALNELSKYESEIVSFSKILNSKVKDIIQSKKEKLDKKVIKVAEPKVEVFEKSELDIEKEKLSIIIFKIDLPTRERIILFGELSVIDSLEDLKKLEKRILKK